MSGRIVLTDGKNRAVGQLCHLSRIRQQGGGRRIENDIVEGSPASPQELAAFRLCKQLRRIADGPSRKNQEQVLVVAALDNMLIGGLPLQIFRQAHLVLSVQCPSH